MSRSLMLTALSVPALLGSVSPAAAIDYLNPDQAMKSLFATASRFAPVDIKLDKQQLADIKKMAGVPQRTASPKIWLASQNGTALGWMIIDEVIGKHDYITYAAAISVDGHVLGIEIMSYRETHGGQIINPAWRAKFRGKVLADPFKLNTDIPNISGATLSSRNVTDGVKRLLALHAVALVKQS
jgi:Na+-translocating ferredoxin:NAD+ oxidoreductase RnfG subunit